MRGSRICRAGIISALVLAVAVLAVPAFAQSGQVKGKVVDAQNKPVEKAKITFLAVETNRKMETSTDRKGEFRQVGLSPGNYTITAEKDGLTQSFDVRVSLDTKEVNFSLSPTTGGADPAKEAARIEGIKAAFAEGATLSNSGKFDEAIAKFEEVIKQVPTCGECYSNIGSIHSRKQDWAKAEEAYRKAIEVNPKYIDAYNGLANAYNAQKKFKEAQAISSEGAKIAGAAGGPGGGAPGLYNQGVIAWNANDFAKAQELFEAAVKADPNHADSHFRLGLVLVKLGAAGDVTKFGEAATAFETYLKLAPTGPYAKEAQSNFDQLKSFRK